VDNLNKTSNNWVSNLPSPSNECNCTMKEYDLINKDNEKVAKTLEYILGNKNVCIMDAIQKGLKDSINSVICNLYEKNGKHKKKKKI